MSKTHKQKPTISSGLLFIAFADFSISEKSDFFKLPKTMFYCLLLSFYLNARYGSTMKLINIAFRIMKLASYITPFPEIDVAVSKN